MFGEILRAARVSMSGARANEAWLKVSAENIAGSHSLSQKPGGRAYEAKFVTFCEMKDKKYKDSYVKVGPTLRDTSYQELEYRPGHPGADENGFVSKSNVNTLTELVNIKEARHAYDANLLCYQCAMEMAKRIIPEV
jgi:flagellar basal-body rod protein FlgC